MKFANLWDESQPPHDYFLMIADAAGAHWTFSDIHRTALIESRKKSENVRCPGTYFAIVATDLCLGLC